ncbi:hypothetical protein I8J29_26400 [Paenibacillus sp. MWE-103]|uniref:DUF4367 domain-containing protein n=1 Tax=Paenibacillus artemisiicola TaxID=1172618 RepID=A0ABS3WHF2_9BACL|nr:hypothetical protein [Paenibacillus artemisiicola]MBO7747725.1 hypothetical protein [Paenibacillus artemisiicola]
MNERKQADKRGPELDVTDEQIEDALNRLFKAVKNEPVPDTWRERSEMETKPEMTPAMTPAMKMNEGHATGSLPANGEIAEPFGLEDAQGERAQAAFAPMAARKRRQAKRRWLSAAAAVVVAGTMLFTSWGQDVMAGMLNTFRVQHFETVSFSQADLDGFRDALENGTIGKQQLDMSRYGEIEHSGDGKQRAVGAAEAETLAGRPLKQLPGADLKAIAYMPQQQLTFKLHPKEINKLIAMLGGKTEFPAAIDDEAIKLTVPGSFSMDIRDPKTGDTSKHLMQLPSPSLDVPSGVDVDRIRQAVLDLPVLPDDLRTKLAAIGDWRTTLPVPTIEGEGDKLHTVTIGGHDAIVSTNGHERMLIWLENDWMYVLGGSTDAYPTEDALTKEAKGLMK